MYDLLMDWSELAGDNTSSGVTPYLIIISSKVKCRSSKVT